MASGVACGKGFLLARQSVLMYGRLWVTLERAHGCDICNFKIRCIGCYNFFFWLPHASFPSLLSLLILPSPSYKLQLQPSQPALKPYTTSIQEISPFPQKQDPSTSSSSSSSASASSAPSSPPPQSVKIYISHTTYYITPPKPKPKPKPEYLYFSLTQTPFFSFPLSFSSPF